VAITVVETLVVEETTEDNLRYWFPVMDSDSK
jgi:hypothetical protein